MEDKRRPAKNSSGERSASLSRNNSYSPDDPLESRYVITEGGYVSDVSSTESPVEKANHTNQQRRRVKQHSTENIASINTESDTDNDDIESNRFRRRARNRYTRKQIQSDIFDDVKTERRVNKQNNYIKNRLSWTDSGISTSRTDRSVCESSNTESSKMRSKYYEAKTGFLDNDSHFRNIQNGQYKMERNSRISNDFDNHRNGSREFVNRLRSNRHPANPISPIAFGDKNSASLRSDYNNEFGNTNRSDMRYGQNKVENGSKRVHDERKTEKENARPSAQSQYAVFRYNDKNPSENLYKHPTLDASSKTCHTVSTSPGIPSRSKGLMNGLKKAASHFKPNIFVASYPKDVTSEFTYAKKRNDEDTANEMLKITNSFCNKVKELEEIDKKNLESRINKYQNNTSSVNGNSCLSSNEHIQNFSNKSKKHTSLIEKIFQRSRSYQQKQETWKDKKMELNDKILRSDSPDSRPLYHKNVNNLPEHNNVYNEAKFSPKLAQYSHSHQKHCVNKNLSRVQSLASICEPGRRGSGYSIGGALESASTPTTPLMSCSRRSISSISTSSMSELGSCDTLASNSNCEECTYIEYLDYLEFRRFRQAVANDVGLHHHHNEDCNFNKVVCSIHPYVSSSDSSKMSVSHPPTVQHRNSYPSKTYETCTPQYGEGTDSTISSDDQVFLPLNVTSGKEQPVKAAQRTSMYDTYV